MRLFTGPMLLVISAVLALFPLLGILWVLTSRTILTVDGLFLSLILLTISGVFALNAFWEFQRARKRRKFFAGLPRTAKMPAAMAASGAVVQGLVQRVDFYEAHVGQANKSVITILNGGAPRILVLAGDLRNRVPAGKRVQLVYQLREGVNTLVAADYS